MIITLDLCLRRGGFTIIDGLNMHIEKGEFAYICGQAGSGKTSLLRMLALQMAPTEGRVIIDGVEFSEIVRRSSSAYRRSLGVIFAEDHLLAHRTLEENVALSLELAGWQMTEARRATREHLKEIGLLEKASLFPNEVSENEKQLLKICRALARRPKIILADEPYEGLDAESIEKAGRLLRKAHIQGTTVAVATHHVELAEQFEGRLIMLDRRSFDLKMNFSASPER